MLTINDLNSKPAFSSAVSNSWIDIRSVNSNYQLSKQYADICQQHETTNKWILMINPEGQSLDKLASCRHIDTQKILKVNTNKSRVNLDNVASALSKGNCSAIILCNPSLKEEELVQLKQCAEQGKTACIVLTEQQQLH